jgi:hypothetical protein
MEQLEQRFSSLRTRIQTAYEGLGQSSGRPYLYFVYAPEADQQVRRLIDELFGVLPSMYVVRVDVLDLTIGALRDEEVEREALLVDPDPAKSREAPREIAGIWQEELRELVLRELETASSSARPIVFLEGLAALHPLTNPTAVMEAFAEHTIDHPATGRPVPIVLFVPGFLVPHMSRTYHFLTQTSQPLLMYRGEDV